MKTTASEGAWRSSMLAGGALVALLIGGAAGSALAWRVADAANSNAEAPPLPSAGRQVAASPLARDPNAVFLSDRAKSVMVGLVARPGGPVDIIALTLRGPADPRSVSVVLETKQAAAATHVTRCGFGCLRLREPVMRGEPVELVVRVARAGSPAVVDFTLPPRLPPSARQLLAHANTVMAAEKTLRSRQVLTSGTTRAVTTTLAMQAPDRVEYQTSSGGRTILIGKTRWDNNGDTWTKRRFGGVRVPTYPWTGARGARLIGTETVDGKRVRLISAFHPRSPAWFTLAVDGSGRVAQVTMHAQGHFMTETYRFPKHPLQIRPPRF